MSDLSKDVKAVETDVSKIVAVDTTKVEAEVTKIVSEIATAAKKDGTKLEDALKSVIAKVIAGAKSDEAKVVAFAKKELTAFETWFKHTLPTVITACVAVLVTLGVAKLLGI